MKQAFTLIELLVAVTLIVVLLALLAPALDKAMEAAVRVKCAGNLHGWALALPQYVLDHKNRLPASPVPPYPVPNFPLVREVADSPAIAMDTLASYFQSTRDSSGPQWYCPANTNPANKAYNDDRAKNAVAGNLVEDLQFKNRFFPEYAYFARVDLFPDAASQPQDLVGRRLAAGKLVMADQLYRWHANNAWSFNHSEIGPAFHGSASLVTGPPPVTGTNQFLGDGAVIWKDGANFDRVKLDNMSEDTGEGYVSPDGLANGDVNFY